MIQMTMFKDETTGKKFYKPIFCCDACRKQITNADFALYKWQDDEEGNPIPGTFVLLHKGVCDEAHNRVYSAARWAWDEATSLLGRLINNAQGEDEESLILWPHLVEHYCPFEQLRGVEQVSSRILRNPTNRPPSINDIAL